MQQQCLFTEPPVNAWFSDALRILEFEETPGWPDVFGRKLRAALFEQPKIKTLSLFSGGGGLDIGFTDAGFEIVECVEIDKRFAQTLAHNARQGRVLHNTRVKCTDIRTYVPQCSDIEFIIGGPPCQSFSAAGVRAAGVSGMDDRRGTLFEEYVRILKQLKPKGFLFENVYRIVGAQAGRAWRAITEAFQAAGYNLFWRIVDAAEYGVPQFRERLIIVGIREGEFKFPVPTHGPDAPDRRDYYTAGWAVKTVDTTGTKSGLSGRHGYLLDDIPPGLNYSFYTEKLGYPNPIFAWRSKFSDYLYKADPETPCRTIKAQGGQYTGPLSWENRHFTVDEYKRLQTFPDEYELQGNHQIAVMQLGNSVPPQAARVLALAVRDQVFAGRIPFELTYLPREIGLVFHKRKSDLTQVYAAKAAAKIAALYRQGKFDKRKPQHSNGCETLYLSPDFSLRSENHLESEAFDYSFDQSQARWQFEVRDHKKEGALQYCIAIQLSKSHASLLGTTSIALRSFSFKHASLLAIWKFLERRVREFSEFDDLVQLFGYYQYRNGSVFEFSFHNEDLTKEPFWQIVDHITKGDIVGASVHLDELERLFDIDQHRLLDYIRKIKDLGFEIRSSNTNSQLATANILIPYQFPTLNERSVQRFKRL